MLDQALVVLASAFGAAVASAAGTEVWSGFRDRAALIFGRRDARETQVVLERLDRSALELDRADPGGADQVRTRLEASWQAWCEDLLESLGEADREEAAGQLRELVARQAAGGVRDAVLSAYAEAAVTVTDPDDPQCAGLDDPERAAVRFLAWAQSTDRRWLIVLDDVSDPAHLNGTDGRGDLWPPARPNGRTVVTTRRRDAALPGHLIDVGLFTKGEAVG
jgi:hypothetical protein